MKVGDLVKLSFRSISAHKLESFFIVLALAVGVSVVTTTLAFLLYSSKQMKLEKNSIYMRGMIVESKTDNWRTVYDVSGIPKPLGEIGRVGESEVKIFSRDLDTIRKISPDVQYAYLQQPVFDLQEFGKPPAAKWEDNDFIATMFTPDYIQVRNLRLVRGSLITPEEYRDQKNVALITKWLAKKRFGTTSPIGQILKFDDLGRTVAFRIVGVVEPSATDFSFKNESGQSLGGISIILPWGSGGEAFLYINRLDLQLNFVSFPGKIEEAYSQISEAVAKLYGPGVTIRRNDASRKRSIQTFSVVAFTITILGSSGLLLAALNITNLMLARVLSRSRQIGISMALGASKRQIFTTYLSESLALGVIGGIVGSGLSILLIMATQSILLDTNLLSIRLSFEPIHAAIGMGLALGVGVLFGLYPALAAAKTPTAEMLRSA